jgi:alpha-tubulin suppressor-like RCC1 family protein
MNTKSSHTSAITSFLISSYPLSRPNALISVLTVFLLLSVAPVDAATLAVSADHTLQIRGNAVYAWGYNGVGQLGVNAPSASIVSVPVLANLIGITPTAVAAGVGWSAALDSTGQLWGWGNIGHAGISIGATPQIISFPPGVSVTKIFPAVPYALGSDGNLYGYSSGSGSAIITNGEPAGLPAGKQIADVAYNDGYGRVADGKPPYIILTSDGGVYLDEIVSGYTAQLVPMPVAAIQIAASGWAGNFALGTNHVLYVWGAINGGLTSDGTGCAITLSGGSTINGIYYLTTPVPAPGLSVGVSAVAGGDYDVYATGTNGSVYPWGDNSTYEFGNGSVGGSACMFSASVTTIPSGVSLTSISPSVYQNIQSGGSVLATGSDGKLYAWGENGEGNLGNGTLINVATPDGLTPQTIAFSPPDFSGNGTFSVSATDSSGLPISYASQTPSTCTVSGNVVTVIVEGGQCIIAATQAGNGTYEGVESVQSISIGAPSDGPIPLWAYGLLGLLLWWIARRQFHLSATPT